MSFVQRELAERDRGAQSEHAMPQLIAAELTRIRF
jgi:hypothetical protein